MKKIIEGSMLVIGSYIIAWTGIIHGFGLLTSGLESMVARKEEKR